MQYLERSLFLLIITSVSDLPLHTINFCSVVFGVPVEAYCHEQDSLMRGLSSWRSAR